MGLTNVFGKKPAEDCHDGSGLMFPHSEPPIGGGRGEPKPGGGAGAPQGGRASTTARGLVVVTQD